MTNETIHYLDVNNDLDTQVELWTKDKELVSDGEFYRACGALGLLAAGSALCAATYAWDVGNSYFSKILLSAVIVGAEIAFVVLCNKALSGSYYKTLTKVVVFGLALVGVLHLSSFWISQEAGHESSLKMVAAETRQKNVDNLFTQQEELQREISYNIGSVAKVNERIERNINALDEQVSEVKTPTTAIFQYAENVTSISANTLSLLLRCLWSVIIILAIMTLSSYLGSVYTLKQRREYFKMWLDEKLAYQQEQKNYDTFFKKQKA